MDAEKIILTKEFHELTASELELVADYASNQAEFDDVKQFLLATNNSFSKDKIVASDALNENILSHLNSPIQNHQPWYNSLFVFLFPRDRRFYQYPAFQLAIASVLVFGVFNLFKSDLKESNLALNDTVQEENKVTTSEEQIAPSKPVVEEIESEKTEEEVPVLMELLDSEEVTYGEEDVPQDLKQEVDKVMDLAEFTVVEKEEVAEEAEVDLNNDIAIFEEEKDNYTETIVQSQPTTELNGNADYKANSSVEDDASRKKKDVKLFNRQDNTIVTAKNNESGAINQPAAVVSADEIADEEQKVVVKSMSVQQTSELNQLFFEVK